ncbi:MAG: polymerase, sigma 28 subunit, FliA/WhiG subfamily [Myxococcaceae bacterium]|nr:polymerase, sigma 28 subunit, FliA/WhiG subfamily [Myxococcaceae bacterium]
MHDGVVAVESRLAWENGAAREALRRYEGLVQAIARRLAPAARMGQALDQDDLCAEGRIAVLEALRTYQGFGIEERTWVATRIRQRMIDAIRRLDTRTRDELRLFSTQAASDAQDDSAEASSSDSRERRERVRALVARRLISLDSSASADAEPLSARLHDQYVRPADEVADQNAMQRRLLRAVERLPERQRVAIELSLFEGLPLREIGERMGVTESRVCQLHKRAIEMLRRALSVPVIVERTADAGALHAA